MMMMMLLMRMMWLLLWWRIEVNYGDNLPWQNVILVILV
jgi:hypothetical protein